MGRRLFVEKAVRDAIVFSIAWWVSYLSVMNYFGSVVWPLGKIEPTIIITALISNAVIVTSVFGSYLVIALSPLRARAIIFTTAFPLLASLLILYLFFALILSWEYIPRRTFWVYLGLLALAYFIQPHWDTCLKYWDTFAKSFASLYSILLVLSAITVIALYLYYAPRDVEGLYTSVYSTQIFWHAVLNDLSILWAPNLAFGIELPLVSNWNFHPISFLSIFIGAPLTAKLIVSLHLLVSLYCFYRITEFLDFSKPIRALCSLSYLSCPVFIRATFMDDWPIFVFVSSLLPVSLYLLLRCRHSRTLREGIVFAMMLGWVNGLVFVAGHPGATAIIVACCLLCNSNDSFGTKLYIFLIVSGRRFRNASLQFVSNLQFIRHSTDLR